MDRKHRIVEKQKATRVFFFFSVVHTLLDVVTQELQVVLFASGFVVLFYSRCFEGA